jgi:hypothetical protein
MDPDDCAPLIVALGVERQAEVTRLLLEPASDPVWAALAAAFAPAHMILSRFADLGPRHAATYEHAHHGLVAFATIVFEGLEREDGSESARLELIRRAEALAESAAQMSWDQPLLTLTAPSGRSLERAALVLEGAEISRLAYREARQRLACALNAARVQIWALLSGEGSPPPLVMRRRGDDLGLGVLGQLSGHENHRRSVFVDVERFALASALRQHRLPDLDGLDPVDLARFEPCAAMAGGLVSDEAGLVLLHELIHARAASDLAPFAPHGEHADIADQVRALLAAEDRVLLAPLVLRCGLAVAVDLGEHDKSGTPAFRPLHTLTLLDEALVELAARRLGPAARAISDPLLWHERPDTPLWGGLLEAEESSYLTGVRLIERLLPEDTDLIELLCAPDRFARMRRLLASGASLAVSTPLHIDAGNGPVAITNFKRDHDGGNDPLLNDPLMVALEQLVTARGVWFDQ